MTSLFFFFFCFPTVIRWCHRPAAGPILNSWLMQTSSCSPRCSSTNGLLCLIMPGAAWWDPNRLKQINSSWNLLFKLFLCTVMKSLKTSVHFNKDALDISSWTEDIRYWSFCLSIILDGSSTCTAKYVKLTTHLSTYNFKGHWCNNRNTKSKSNLQ